MTGRIVVGEEKLNTNNEPVDVIVVAQFSAQHLHSGAAQISAHQLDTFDAPVMPQLRWRVTTTIAPQSLMLMNDQFVVDNRSLAISPHGNSRRHRARVVRMAAPVQRRAVQSELTNALTFWDRQIATLWPKATRVESRRREPLSGAASNRFSTSNESRCPGLCSRRHFLHANAFEQVGRPRRF
jgi:hypothetical protein